MNVLLLFKATLLRFYHKLCSMDFYMFRVGIFNLCGIKNKLLKLFKNIYIYDLKFSL